MSVSCSSCYVAHLASGQLDLVNRQEPIERAIQHEPDPARRALLAEAPLITAFARDVLALKPSDSYVGYYAVDRPWLTLVLSAAPRDRLEPYTRWYPIAGRVPYRSYFDETRAKHAQAELEDAGYDTYLHPSPAYSTLGFFRDPITTPMLDRAPPCPPPEHESELDGCRVAGLAETLIHELTHQHLYVAGETDFNEQLASFVGRTGAIEYLAYRGLYDRALKARLEVAYQRQHQFESEVRRALRELEALYESARPREQKLALREPIFARLAQVATSIFPGSTADDFRMNNARILQYRRYARGAEPLSEAFDRVGGDWRRFWSVVHAELEPR